MTQFFATLGALIYFVLILNIFLITFSVGFAGTPAVTFLMLLATVYLLFWDWHRLWPILSEQKIEVKSSITEHSLIKHPLWAIVGLIIFLTTVGFQLYFYGNIIAWFSACFLEGLVGFILYFILARRKNFSIKAYPSQSSSL